jgi:hypothetical protein
MRLPIEERVGARRSPAAKRPNRQRCAMAVEGQEYFPSIYSGTTDKINNIKWLRYNYSVSMR